MQTAYPVMGFFALLAGFFLILSNVPLLAVVGVLLLFTGLLSPLFEPDTQLSEERPQTQQEPVITYARQWIEGVDRFVQFVGDTFFRGESAPALQMAREADRLLGSEATVPATEYTVGPVTLSILDDPDKEDVAITLTLTNDAAEPVTVRLLRNPEALLVRSPMEQMDESQVAPTLEETVELSAEQPRVTRTLPRAGGNKFAGWEIEVDVPPSDTI